MATSQKLTQALEELKRQTGLDLQLNTSQGTEDDTSNEEAAEKIRMLTSAYREKYDKSSFIRNLVQGNIAGTDLYATASRFHISESEKRILYVIECREQDVESAERIIRNLFLGRSGDLFTIINEKRMVLIKTFKEKDGEEKYRSLGNTMIDMLNTEAMIPAKTGYSTKAESLRDMPKAYQEACLALEIGRVFSGNESVFSYDRLGIGRLIHDLPEEPCRLYLKELFGSSKPISLDEETLAIVNAFFDNNLNVSETARQLYVHRNTLVYRLEKVHQETGLDLRKFDDAVEMKIALMISENLTAQSL